MQMLMKLCIALMLTFVRYLNTANPLEVTEGLPGLSLHTYNITSDTSIGSLSVDAGYALIVDNCKLTISGSAENNGVIIFKGNSSLQLSVNNVNVNFDNNGVFDISDLTSTDNWFNKKYDTSWTGTSFNCKSGSSLILPKQINSSGSTNFDPDTGKATNSDGNKAFFIFCDEGCNLIYYNDVLPTVNHESKKITVKSASGNTEYQSDSVITQKTFLQILFQTRPNPQALLNSPSISDLELTSVNVLDNILDLTENHSNLNPVIDKTNDIHFSIRTTPSKGLTIAPEVTISSPIRIQLALTATQTVPEDEEP